MGKLSLRLIGIVGALCTLATIGLPADTFTTLVSFNGANGSIPLYGTLIQGLNGNFYGTTEEGGADNRGTAFEINPGGTLTTLYSFGSTLNDGGNPLAGLVLATNGNFYGTTYNFGANGSGTVFKITPGGKSTTPGGTASSSGTFTVTA